jgi:hypothetical protein
MHNPRGGPLYRPDSRRERHARQITTPDKFPHVPTQLGIGQIEFNGEAVVVDLEAERLRRRTAQ